MEPADYSRCVCGAITVFTDDGVGYSVDERLRNRLMPGIDLRRLRRLQDSYCCDHCVNHWGLDLCGCGSGEFFGECENGYPECEQPAQILMGRTRVTAGDGWLI